MNMLKSLIGGLIAGLVGAAIWAAISFWTGYEIGWIAWGIGGLVGFAVALGGQQGMTAGLAAVVISVLAIMGGKYATVELLVNKELGGSEQMVEQAVDRLENEEFVVSWLADGIIEERTAQGEEITWPPGVTAEEAEQPDEESEYPPEIWSEAASQWDGMPPEERDAYRAQLADMIRQNIEENFAAFRTEIKRDGFSASFGPLDIVFILLAVVTAFKIGRGTEEVKGEVEYEDDLEAEVGTEGEAESSP